MKEKHNHNSQLKTRQYVKQSLQEKNHLKDLLTIKDQQLHECHKLVERLMGDISNLMNGKSIQPKKCSFHSVKMNHDVPGYNIANK